jgi:fibronectin type 3 domain-containing protein
MKKYLCLLVFLFPVSLFAGNVPLTWDASTSPSVTHYRVYWGTASHAYTNVNTIGNLTTHLVLNLELGTYYFAVTALDADGNESDFSNEISKTLIGGPNAPGVLRFPPVVITNTNPPPKVVGNP